jgi:hypothetical protein
MTAVDKCLTIKAEAGDVDKGKAKAIAARYREAVNEIVAGGRVSVAEAEALAAQQLARAAERDIIRKKRIAFSHAKVLASIRVVANQAEQAGQRVDIAMQQYIANDPRERAVGASLSHRINTVRSQAFRELGEFLEEFRTKHAGLSQNTTGLDDVIRELFGEGTGNASSKNMAQGLKKATEYLRHRFNAAGGDIIDRGDWGFFQIHDKLRVSSSTAKEWIEFVDGLLAKEKMVDPNGNPMTAEQLKRGLQEAYQSIASGGLSDITRPIGPNIFGSSVNKRANARFLQFKNADAWLEYQRKFGNSHMFDHIVGSISSLSREVAILEILGPHPEAALKFMDRLADEASARTAIAGTGRVARVAAEKISRAGSPLMQLYNTVTGRTAIPGGAGWVASASQNNRNVVIAATLGSSWLVALGDTVTAGLTARMNGMSSTKLIARHIQLFSKNSAGDRELALQLGLGAQGMASRALGVQRIMGEVTGAELTERIADTTMRLGLLSPWTEAGRWAFGIEFLAHITNSTGKGFDEIDPMLQRSFQRHGITSADWDLIRSTDKWVDPESGAKFLRADDVTRGEFGTPAFDAANRLQQAIFAETEFAIVSAAPQVKAAMTALGPAGTFWGEVMRNSFLFKGFPLSVQYMHWNRIMAMQGAGQKVQYAAWMVGGMTSVGAMAHQLSQIATGKDPINMDPRENLDFWARAIAKGGSLGLLGDIVFSDHNRWGTGLFEGLLGPVAGQVGDVTKMTLGNAQKFLSGDDTSLGRDLSQFVQKNTPGQTLWYTRLAMERILFDELDKLLDPKAYEYFRQIEQRAQTENRQQYYWHRGRKLPSRAPDIPEAIGQ